MNIFVLDYDIARCARYHCDQHIVKMILESAQILCTVLNKKGYQTPYKPTHQNHPCVIWAGKSYTNFRWLCKLAFALDDEYRFRFEHKESHKSIEVIRKIENLEFEDRGLTEFVQAMPDRFKVIGDAVSAYRNFYIGEKSRFASWKRKRPIPKWYLLGIKEVNKDY
ncbi:MAG: pyrimidine dimer DNA glycosylase/endonuclease V [Candidatus Zixiibacteriota bacterium]